MQILLIGNFIKKMRLTILMNNIKIETNQIKRESSFFDNKIENFSLRTINTNLLLNAVKDTSDLLKTSDFQSNNLSKFFKR